MEVAILIGLQGAGKSTFYRTHLAATHTLISKDAMPRSCDRRKRQDRLLRAHLAHGDSITVDNTNPAPEDRAPIIALAREHGARIVGYYFESRLEDGLRRNAGREGMARVPDVALFVTMRKLLPPSLDEGFDALFHVSIASNGAFRVVPWDEMSAP